MKNTYLKTSLATLAFTAAANLGFAATISFSGPTTIALDDDGSAVLDNGIFKAALNLDGTNQSNPSISLNGISFDNGDSTTANGVTLSFSSGGSLSSNLTSSYSNSSWSNLFNGFATSAGATSGGEIISLSISGLTIGQEYQLQSFHLAAIANPDQRATTIQNASLVDPSTNQSLSFSQIGTASDPAVGMVSTWIADSTTQEISFLSSPSSATFSRSVVNAVVLHDITSIPEPQHMAVIMVGGLGLAMALQRRLARRK